MELFHVAVFCTSFVGGYLFHYVREKVRRKTIRDLVRESFHPDGFTLEHSTNRIKHQVSEEVAREVSELFKVGLPKVQKDYTSAVKQYVDLSERWRGREAVIPRAQKESGLSGPKLTVTSNTSRPKLVVDALYGDPSDDKNAPLDSEPPAKRGKSRVKKW